MKNTGLLGLGRLLKDVDVKASQTRISKDLRNNGCSPTPSMCAQRLAMHGPAGHALLTGRSWEDEMPKYLIGGFALLVALAVAPWAEAQKPVVKANSVTETVTITGIDSTTRHITVRNAKGEEQIVSVGPSVQRFNELKVGQQVQARYYESLVFAVHPPKQTPKGTTGTVDIVPSSGTPGATAALQMVTTVTVTAVDPKAGSITVRTDDGRIVTRKADNPKNLAGVKVGQQIDITYTEAVIVEVLPK
jgi:hypothetical protein